MMCSRMTEGMVEIPAGRYVMGSDDFYPEERPVHDVEVGRFHIDARPVTVREFRRFVKATGYVTVAERPLDPEQYPDADPALLVPGSLVFRPSRGPVDLGDFRNWLEYVPGATWQRPEGPASETYTRGRHPVTQVAYEDAAAYAAWAGNVWEWTCDLATDGHASPCCGPPSEETIPRRVIKGGSHLCAPNYCLRYRPAARQGEAIDTSTSHIGFRCISREPESARSERNSIDK
jgi:formylglycine-generating enzyme required for sulfatase activity